MSSMNDAERDRVLKHIHTTLLPSSKHGVSVDALNREYRSLMGENIPYRAMGFHDLLQMLGSARNICRIIQQPDGSIVIKPQITDEHAHIVEMVQRQNNKKNRKAQFPQRRPNQPQWQPPVAPGSFAMSSGFRHGFRPDNSARNFRQAMMGSQKMADQRNGPGGSGRFSGGRGGNRPGGGAQADYYNGLRAPQTSPADLAGRGNSQPPSRPMSQRLGPPPNQAAPSKQNSTSFVKILEDYFSQNNLGVPVFKTSKIEKKQAATGRGPSKKVSSKFFSTVKVYGQSFQTYPTEYNTEKEAEEAAAKMACEKLNLSSHTVVPGASGDGSTLPTFPADVNVDVLIDRLVQIVGARNNGVWSSRIEVEYSQKFGQALPAGWPVKIQSYQDGSGVKRLNVEKPIQDQDRFIISPHIALVPSDSTVKPEIAPAVKPPEESSASALPVQSHPVPSGAAAKVKKTRVPITAPTSEPVRCQPKPPELILPEDDLWDVYVTHIFSAAEVCVRILGDEYSSKFEDLITDMELHYFNADKIPNVALPQIGHIYAAIVDSEWHRVEVISVKGVDVTCYFIDHGGEHDVHSVDVLREIEPKFLALAPQAKRVRLAGLEFCAASPQAHMELTSAALARSLVGQVHKRENEDVSLILIDTSGETDININENIIERFQGIPDVTPFSPTSSMARAETGNGMTLPAPLASPVSKPSLEMDLTNLDLASFQPLSPPTIPDEGQYFDVIVTLAGSPSNFTVQPYQDSCHLERLMASMKEFYSIPSRHLTMKLDDLAKDSYFAALHTDGQWYRVKINSQLDPCTMAVKIVDYGDFSMVPLENLQPLWPQFRSLPVQAINATLAGIVAVDGDWTVDDTVWFARRVVNNAFVSIIKDLGIDSSEAGSLRLGLSLIDTNNPKADVVIEQELVDKGRAAFFCI